MSLLVFDRKLDNRFQLIISVIDLTELYYRGFPILVKMNVPKWGQGNDHNCVPTCLKMVLEYLSDKHGEKIPRYSIKTIARVIETKLDGTTPKKVEQLNAFLGKAIPSVEFETGFMRTFPEILNELNNERPVIVWINVRDPPEKLWHAVVLTGFDPNTNMLYYNDPWDKSEKISEVGSFIHMWGIEARMVKVLIGKTHQRHIQEWTIAQPSEEQEQ